jgi:hypothetical protein
VPYFAPCCFRRIQLWLSTSARHRTHANFIAAMDDANDTANETRWDRRGTADELAVATPLALLTCSIGTGKTRLFTS